MPKRQMQGKSSKDKSLPDNLRSDMAEAMLGAAVEQGWTDAALRQAAQRLNLPQGRVNLLFPDGIRDVVQAVGEWVDTAMLAKIQRDPRFRTRRTRDKVAYGVMARLDSLLPYRDSYQRLLQWYALPQNLPLAARRLYHTVDLIWREAGDTATDFNFYTKRGLLAGVVKATTLFWLTDETPNQQATREFLERRISEVLRAGKALSLAREWSPQEWLSMARDRLRRAAG